MNYRWTIFILVIFSCFRINGQSVYSGTVKNTVGEGLSGATVTVSKDSTDAILAYGISDSDGDFRLNLNSQTDTVFLKVSYVGYNSWTKQLRNVDKHLEVVLEESLEELREVTVEARIIRQHGDTLSYRVSAFMDQKDRVLADVLKKMPGIEILPGGQIHYQGRPIQKYYIEGLDLLEGRYSLANNNISADDVSDVQILENHQPVKVLDSLEFSDRASLNIKLKNEVTVSGTAEIGGGFSPLLWETKMTPMIFTKKHQAIVSYQSNNTGNDVSREIQDYSFSDFDREEFSISKKDWLSIREPTPPSFEQERWLNNNVHLGSVNYLVRLKKDVDLKTNISYLNDVQQQMGTTVTKFFTPTDTVTLAENAHNNLFVNMLQSKFILERNTDDNYLKNELEINGFWDSQRGNIVAHGTVIRQKLSNPYSVMKNKLRLLRPVGKQLITFRSNTGFSETIQSLNVSPGQFSELLNSGEPYAETKQMLQSSTFFSDNSAGFTKEIKDITIAPEIGFSIRNQQLDSRLGVMNEGVTTYPENNFINKLHFLTSRVYFTSRFNYKKNNWSIRLLTPTIYRRFNVEDAFSGDDQELKRLTFEPSLFVKKQISAHWESSISANLSNNFKDFRSMYNGFILSNYRSIQRYNSDLPESFSQSFSGRLSYRNPLKSIFASVSYTYSLTESNLLYSNFIGEGGAMIFETVEQENNTISQNLRVEGSKYFNKIKTTLKLGSRFSLIQHDQLLNNNLAQMNNQALSFSLGLESEVTDWLSTSYNGSLSFLETSIADKNFNKIESQQHLLDLSFFPAGNQYISLESEYYYNNLSQENRNSNFFNLEYQYTFEERNLDLSATWNNILGTNEFVRVSSNEYSYVQSTYRLRPSQLLLSLKFTF